MNEFTQLLCKGADEVRTLQKVTTSTASRDALLEHLSVRLEHAATITSGIEVQNEAFEIARTISSSKIFDIDSTPSFKQVLETLKQRWQRARSCCRR